MAKRLVLPQPAWCRSYLCYHSLVRSTCRRTQTVGLLRKTAVPNRIVVAEVHAGRCGPGSLSAQLVSIHARDLAVALSQLGVQLAWLWILDRRRENNVGLLVHVVGVVLGVLHNRSFSNVVPLGCHFKAAQQTGGMQSAGSEPLTNYLQISSTIPGQAALADRGRFCNNARRHWLPPARTRATEPSWRPTSS